jgi:hypothetical protein
LLNHGKIVVVGWGDGEWNINGHGFPHRVDVGGWGTGVVRCFRSCWVNIWLEVSM